MNISLREANFGVRLILTYTPEMIKFNTFCLVITLLLSSCSKDDITKQPDESQTNSTEELLLISTEVHSQREAELFKMINDYRLGIDMNPFVFNNVSLYYAREHSTYMASKGTTSHAKFGKRAEQISKLSGAEFVAENVAKDYETIQSAFVAWLESNGHRNNIEGDYTHSAIGIVENEVGDLYFTQLFFR